MEKPTSFEPERLSENQALVLAAGFYAVVCAGAVYVDQVKGLLQEVTIPKPAEMTWNLSDDSK